MDGIAELEGHDPELDWEMPEGIEKVTVCKLSGLIPVAGCPTCTDYCAVENAPTERCKGGHEISIKLCDDSHMRATNACPCVTEYKFIPGNADDTSRTIEGADFEYDEKNFTEECTIHPPVDGEFSIINRVYDGGGTIDPTIGVNTGDTVTIHWQPDQGYVVENVWIDGEAIFNISEYTFENISDYHSVTVKFKKVEVKPEKEHKHKEKHPEGQPVEPQPDQNSDPNDKSQP